MCITFFINLILPVRMYVSPNIYSVATEKINNLAQIDSSAV